MNEGTSAHFPCTREWASAGHTRDDSLRAVPLASPKHDYPANACQDAETKQHSPSSMAPSMWQEA